jgi:Uma2 family endonuclease
MVQTSVQSLTLEEFLQLPETKPASEYMDGQVTQKPMPQGKHSTVQRGLTIKIEGVLKPAKIARPFPELRCTFGGRSIVPDVAIFAWSRIPRDEDGKIANSFQIAPDWTIEILSPDQSSIKVIRNILHCLAQGTEMGWLIDPDEEAVLVYFADQRNQLFDQPEQVLPVPSFASAVQLTVGELFGWLAE